MASDSTTTTTTTTTTNDKPQNPGSETLTPMNEDGQRLQEETTRETSPSIFVNSEPMREDQVQNAVKFLSHPKVRGSPIVYRRSFLEKKGLTKEEIDEAFRRVPDPAPTVTTTVTATQTQDGQSKLATTSQLQVPAQTSQPAIAAPSGVVSTMSTFSRAQFHWYHAFIAIGLLAATGAGTALLFKNAILPRLKAWIRKVVLEEEEDDSMKKKDSKPSVAEEAAAAAKAAAAAAADVAKASLEMLNSRNEEKHHYEAFMNLLGVQVEEMKSMSTAIKKLEGTRAVTISSNKQIEDARYASSNVRPSSAPASVEPAVAPHPKSYMEIMSMVQRGEKPPGIKDINDSPPNPNQPPSNPRLAPRVKPWETGQVQNGSYYGEGSGSGSGSGSNGQYTIPPTSQLNGASSEPLWQQQQRSKNVRISEIEAEDESRMVSSRAAAATNEQQMVRRAWVPPQPPPIAMAEAATAIRQQKTLVQNQTSEDKLIARPSDDIEELQRITKLSESGGGEVEMDNKMGGAAAGGTYLNEIQEEDLGGDGISG